MTKKCAKCGQEKELTEFYKRSDSLADPSSYCKVCHKASRHTNEGKRKQKIADAERIKFEEAIKKVTP